MAFSTSGAAQGAATGTSVAPGWGTAVGALLGGFGGSSAGGGSAGYAPQDAQSAIYGDLGLDASGWNVNFSGVQSSGANKAAPSALDQLGVGTGQISPLMIGGVLVLLGLIVWKKSKSRK